MSTPDTTTAEAAELQAMEADRVAAEEAAAAEAKRLADEAAAAAAAQADPLAAERAALAASQAEAAAAAQAAREAAELVARQQAEAQAAREAAEAEAARVAAEAARRDFDAELSALEEKFDNGDITREAYRQQERQLLEDRALQRFRDEQDAAARESAQRAVQDAEAQRLADWQAAQRTFFTDPGNNALVYKADGSIDNVKLAAFNAAVGEVAQAHPELPFDQLLVQVRARITGEAAIDPAEAVRKAEFERGKNAGDPPVTLRDTPNTGALDSGAAVLDNLPIDKLEDAMARMAPEQLNAYLAGAPGNATPLLT